MFNYNRSTFDCKTDIFCFVETKSATKGLRPCQLVSILLGVHRRNFVLFVTECHKTCQLSEPHLISYINSTSLRYVTLNFLLVQQNCPRVDPAVSYRIVTYL